LAVRLRLRRVGKKKQAEYRLVAAEAAGPRDGRFIETVGHYNPRIDPPAVTLDEERALWWLKHGAQPTQAAKSLLVRAGVWEQFTGEAPEPRAPKVEATAAGEAEDVTPTPEASETAAEGEDKQD
jgi:small subunit ribosomal protein S16